MRELRKFCCTFIILHVNYCGIVFAEENTMELSLSF